MIAVEEQVTRLPRKPKGRKKDHHHHSRNKRKRKGRRVVLDSSKDTNADNSPCKRSIVREALLPHIPKKKNKGLSGYGGWHQKSAKLIIDRKTKEKEEAQTILPTLVPNTKPRHRTNKGRRDSSDKFSKASRQFNQRKQDLFCRRQSAQVDQQVESGTDGELTEWGRYILADGNVFEGCYRNMLKHGKGIMKWGDGSVYAGDWVDDVIHGDGKFEYPNGTALTYLLAAIVGVLAHRFFSCRYGL
jgi:hypothetical protein